MKTIVLAWAEKDGLRETGGMVRRDGVNWFPEFEPCWKGYACVWKNHGTPADKEKARVYLEGLEHPIKALYCYRADDEDCLNKARSSILEMTERRGTP